MAVPHISKVPRNLEILWRLAYWVSHSKPSNQHKDSLLN